LHGGQFSSIVIINLFRPKTPKKYFSEKPLPKKFWVVLTQFLVKYGPTQPLGYIFKLHF